MCRIIFQSLADDMHELVGRGAGAKDITFSLNGLKTKFEKLEGNNCLQCAGNRRAGTASNALGSLDQTKKRSEKNKNVRVARWSGEDPGLKSAKMPHHTTHG